MNATRRSTRVRSVGIALLVTVLVGGCSRISIPPVPTARPTATPTRGIVPGRSVEVGYGVVLMAGTTNDPQAQLFATQSFTGTRDFNLIIPSLSDWTIEFALVSTTVPSRWVFYQAVPPPNGPILGGSAPSLWIDFAQWLNVPTGPAGGVPELNLDQLPQEIVESHDFAKAESLSDAWSNLSDGGADRQLVRRLLLSKRNGDAMEYILVFVEPAGGAGTPRACRCCYFSQCGNDRCCARCAEDSC